MSGRALTAAVRDGSLLRPMNGWYTLPDADQDLIRATRVGGCVAAASATRFHGLASPERGLLHVCVPRNACRLRSASSRRIPAHADSSIRIHWGTDELDVDRRELVVPLQLCLRQVVATEPHDVAIAVLDSALFRQALSSTEFAAMVRGWPSWMRRIATRVDGRSEGFPESIARVRLEDAGIGRRASIRIQPEVVGRRLDIVLGDRLLIEVDGYAHHSTPQQISDDRHRELELLALGFIIIRLTYQLVMHEWDSVLHAIEVVLDRGDHLWPAARRSG
jgi:very-short-patch-repair endonuclease